MRCLPRNAECPKALACCARALAELGRTSDAEAIYKALAGDFDYFGFLAADQLASSSF